MNPLLVFLLLALFVAQLPARAADNLATFLQRALFEEEGNQNLAAAIDAYQTLLTVHENDRRIAATAVFRLGECYRKLGRTNDAVAQYRQLVARYADQTNLVTLSRQNLAGLGAESTLATRAAAVTNQFGGASFPPEDLEIQRIQSLIRNSPDLINALTTGSAPIHTAAREGRLEVVRFLLDHGAQIDLRQNDLATALSLAADNGHRAVVELLLDRGADPNAILERGRTVLHLVAAKGYQSILELLLQRGAKVDLADTSGWFPLHGAAHNHQLRCIDALLKAKADINAANKAGETALHLAVRNRDTTTVALFLERGADVNRRNANGLPPLGTALLDRGEKRDNPPEHIVEVIRRLLDQGADFNFAVDSQPPAHLAVGLNSPEVLRLLLAKKLNVTQANAQGITPLQALVLNRGDHALIPLLVQAGADPSPPLPAQFTLMIRHSNNTTFDVAGSPPLHAAIASGQTAMAAALLDAGADVNAPRPGEFSPTALFTAIYANPPDLVERVLQAKPNLAATRTYEGSTALHVAASESPTNIVGLLLRAGAPVDALDAKGRTPLHVACEKGIPESAALLLQAGADPNRFTGGGLLPLDILRFAAPTPQPGFGGRIASPIPPPAAPIGVPMVSPSFPGSTSVPSSARPQPGRHTEILPLLLRHGADESLARRHTLQVTRVGRNFERIVFRRGTNSFNRHTLFEVVLDTFDNNRLAFPDLKHVAIHRLQPDGREQVQVIDVQAAVDTIGDEKSHPNCTNDVWLEWGDRIEFPEDDHPLSAVWGGFDGAWKWRLIRCLEREVQVVTNQRTNRLQLNVRGKSPEGVPMFPFARDSFRLHDVLKQSGLFTSTSGLNVRVTRVDPMTRQRDTFAFTDVNRPLTSEMDLWLRAGDVIEVR